MTAPAPLQFPETWIVVAAYNEESVIAGVLRGLEALGNIVLVDDCSTDRTGEIAQALLPEMQSLHLLRHPVNLGQGAALQTGIKYALERRAEYIVTFDADGQHTPESIPSLIVPLQSGEVDVVLGSRFCDGGTAENITSRRRKLLQLATLFTRTLTQLQITDTHNGLRAFTRDAASQLSITQDRMAHATQILVQIRKHELRYREVPVRVLYTDYSLEKGQKISNAVNILWDSFTEFLWK